MDSAVLSAKGVSKRFGALQSKDTVLKDISITFTQPQSYAITGHSGTGKSTLMHILAGLDQPTEGSVWFNNLEISRMSEHEKSYFLNKSVGLLFQQPHMIKELSVIENVKMPAVIAGLASDQADREANGLLARVGLVDKAHEKPGALSGGQQQRAALARALINRPQFLLADEPTGNLDEQTAHLIVDLLLDLQEEWGMGIIVSTHDSYVAQKMDHILELNEGKIA